MAASGTRPPSHATKSCTVKLGASQSSTTRTFGVCLLDITPHDYARSLATNCPKLVATHFVIVRRPSRHSIRELASAAPLGPPGRSWISVSHRCRLGATIPPGHRVCASSPCTLCNIPTRLIYLSTLPRFSHLLPTCTDACCDLSSTRLPGAVCTRIREQQGELSLSGRVVW